MERRHHERWFCRECRPGAMQQRRRQHSPFGLQDQGPGRGAPCPSTRRCAQLGPKAWGHSTGLAASHVRRLQEAGPTRDSACLTREARAVSLCSPWDRHWHSHAPSAWQQGHEEGRGSSQPVFFEGGHPGCPLPGTHQSLYTASLGSCTQGRQGGEIARVWVLGPDQHAHESDA